MSLTYTIKESFSGFQRTKLSTTLAVITVWIALVLLGLFVVASVNTQRFLQVLRDRVEMEAFIHEPYNLDDLDRMENSIRQLRGVDSTIYVSKQDAAEVFQREFGEDIHRVLEFNPLPPSFKITLRGAYKNADSARVLHRQVSAVAGIDTVVYRRMLLQIIDTRTTIVYRIALGLGVFVALSAILLVANTIRLAIYAKRHLIDTMELLGATRGFIRLPFLIEGMLQGVLGGILAGLLLNVAIEHLAVAASPELASFIHMPAVFYVGVVVLGGLLGLAGSAFSVVRFLKE
ncbi:MAG TPA: ABC transporter permease [Bacteroidota bacterium]